MRRSQRSFTLWVIAGFVLLGFAAALPLDLVTQRPNRPHTGRAAAPTSTPATSRCVAALQKDANPRQLSLGDSAQASLAISITCAAELKPVDLVFVADESNSMAKDSGLKDPATPDPNSTAGPGLGTPKPTEDPGSGPGGGGNEPSWCSANPGGGLRATDTPTPRRPPRRTATPGGGGAEPTAVLEVAGNQDLVKSEKSFIGDFLDRNEIKRDLANDRLRIGFVSFNSQAKVKQPLTNESSKIISAAGRMRGDDITRIQYGVREGEKMLAGSGARVELGDEGRVKMMVLMSDFGFCQKDVRSGGTPSKEINVITVGFGREYNRKLAADLATSRNMALEPTDLKEVVHLYEDVLAPPLAVTVKDLKAHDELAANMELVAGSVQPVTATITGQLIEWQLDPLKLPWALGYQVKPQEAGVFPISAAAGVAWTDSKGLPGVADFPYVDLDVIPFTETPSPTPTDTATPTDMPTATNTATPTATATRTPAPRYIPVAYKLWPEAIPTQCVPEQQTADTALIVDTSTSMSDPTQAGGVPKLTAAIDAAIEIVNLMKPGDQATVIGFNATGFKASDLTSDKAQLIAALHSLANRQSPGTAIDQGLLVAFDELQSPRHLPGNSRSMVLVTDGTQTTGGDQVVRDAANTIKAAGIQIVTVGLGSNVDEALLTEIASSPDLYFRSPTAEGLVEIYREIAKLTPCP